MNDDAPVLVLDNIRRVYQPGGHPLEVLKGASMQIGAGDLVGLIGPSGSGKSTLLHVTGLLEFPDDGDVLVGGKSCGGLSDKERTKIRRDDIGFVYQFHHLLPEFSALENIMLPQMLRGTGRRAARERARALLDEVGLSARAEHRPARLSGGEQQRVALARALANEPRLLLADEPTGNLDTHTAEDVFELLVKIIRSTNLSALIATHNLDLAKKMDRIIRLEDGILVPA